MTVWIYLDSINPRAHLVELCRHLVAIFALICVRNTAWTNIHIVNEPARHDFTIVQFRYLYPYKDGHIVIADWYMLIIHISVYRNTTIYIYILIERQIHSWPRLVGYIKLYLTISLLHDHSITIASPYLLVHVQGWSTPSYQETHMTLFETMFQA